MMLTVPVKESWSCWNFFGRISVWGTAGICCPDPIGTVDLMFSALSWGPDLPELPVVLSTWDIRFRNG